MPRPLPNTDVDDFESVGEFIFDFYKTLGWNPACQELEPRKITIHPEIWNHIAEQIIQKWDRLAALTWMNIGPSVDDELDKNEIFVARGAFIDESITFSSTG